MNNIENNNQTVHKILNYIIIKPRQRINLNLFEGEKYEPAIVIQQLVGNLIYYSNFGRYETRLAESWIKTDEFTWTFKLKSSLMCENGELINSASFKKSLERSIHIFEKKGGVPILSSLVGYKKFVSDNRGAENINELAPIEGIQASGYNLIFKFDKKIKSGFLQILSFSPFGYICSENFDNKGNWNDDLKFVSSGPYKVDKIDVGRMYHLVRNPKWLEFSTDSPNEVIITHDDKGINEAQPTIIDAFTNEYSNEKLDAYKLVPEYINSILLGNYDKGYFSSRQIRTKFKNILDRESANLLPAVFGVNTRSNSFYPNQRSTKANEPANFVENLAIPTKTLVIEGTLPINGTSRWHSWNVLKQTLDKLRFPYKFAENEATFDQMTNKDFDIRIRGSSIGGGVEAWGLYVSFCSSMGINFPDPNKLVCNLIEKYENDEITESELSDQFLKIVAEEAAILPISHYGVQLFLTKHLDTESFSPLLAIMKFDKIRIIQ